MLLFCSLKTNCLLQPSTSKLAVSVSLCLHLKEAKAGPYKNTIM